ncbi:hypothetical protein GFL09_14675 [Pseudomonas stutzeri]|uniref:cyclodeaminase/cyclohydrolase family protein n=1 Tax=Stutzerimonas stutzeri TaxID=316 RepID=UPI001909DBBA|nr:cyclodeaminase/cyclohydrolase family protein [Stutzerimonas stutzeri]MBK3868910.1 hypothetical protein [Stutzerimonas stutzeri]
MPETKGAWNWTLADFRSAIAAAQPTPGCGAAAAVTADIGLALILKGLRISEVHGTGAVRQHLVRSAETLLGRPGAFADDDMQAFDDYLSAARRGQPESRQAASRQTCAVPLATAHCCLQALGLAVSAWPLVLPMLRSDVQAGALLVHAGLSAALINVDADLPMVEDVAERDLVAQARQRLQEQADERLRRLLDLVQDAAAHVD